MDKAPRPTEVRHLREERRVRLTWSDGHVAEYPLEYLRGWCPCAACQGHGGEKHFVEVREPRLEAIRAVGSYALTFVWEDGHETGIYSWQYLRRICPCPQCRTATD